MSATFSNPWIFLKKTNVALNQDDISDEILMPTFEYTKARIPEEIQSRSGIERTLGKWISDIPTEPQKLDDAVDLVQLLVLKVYAVIRSQICDQIELFAESFFKLPLMRRLEEDMNLIELDEVSAETYRIRFSQLQEDFKATSEAASEVKECHVILDNFKRKTLLD